MNLSPTPKDRALILKIAERFRARRVELGMAEPDRLEVAMDLAATHLNGCPLDLDKLLTTDNVTLAHDVAGIAGHLDRTTGALEGFFLPRCALPAPYPEPAEQREPDTSVREHADNHDGREG